MEISFCESERDRRIENLELKIDNRDLEINQNWKSYYF
jgi:hypothetical protein